MPFNLPKLDYNYNELEPHIDAKTMEIHYSKHHSGYVDKLNKAIAGTEYEENTLENLIQNYAKLPQTIAQAVRNNAGGHSNHTLFWTILSPKGGGNPNSDNLQFAINGAFGSIETFRERFSEKALSIFGSGWAWLCVDNNKNLTICSTPNQDSPITDGLKPILGLDVWEHAYYLNYQNRRPDYIKGFWNLVNWDKVSDYYSEAT